MDSKSGLGCLRPVQVSTFENSTINSLLDFKPLGCTRVDTGLMLWWLFWLGNGMVHDFLTRPDFLKMTAFYIGWIFIQGILGSFFFHQSCIPMVEGFYLSPFGVLTPSSFKVSIEIGTISVPRNLRAFTPHKSQKTQQSTMAILGKLHGLLYMGNILWIRGIGWMQRGYRGAVSKKLRL